MLTNVVGGAMKALGFRRIVVLSDDKCPARA